jgi:hypothetical protein
MKIEDWESRFEKQLQQIGPSELLKPGALLPLIPCHEEWEEFVATINSEWRIDVADHVKTYFFEQAPVRLAWAFIVCYPVTPLFCVDIANNRLEQA